MRKNPLFNNFANNSAVNNTNIHFCFRPAFQFHDITESQTTRAKISVKQGNETLDENGSVLIKHRLLKNIGESLWNRSMAATVVVCTHDPSLREKRDRYAHR